jgi:chromate transporter
LQRAGPAGALAAWLGFTLPSALLLMVFALGAGAFSGPLGIGVLHGLKLVAVAIVAQAVWGMARTLCPDRSRQTIALAAVLMVVLIGGATGQVGAILLGGFAGLWLCRDTAGETGEALPFPVSRQAGIVALALFFILIFGLPLAAALFPAQGLAVIDAFYRAGALVFGGGHVVLPLLEAEVVRPGWVTPDAFLAGYGAAQAVPGPLFTFAAYLGMLLEPGPNGIAGATLALLAIFLPGFLLLVGALPFWNTLRARSGVRAPMAGANAAVVGILGAALYDPLWISAIGSPRDFALALTCFVALMSWRFPPWLVVLIAAAGGAILEVSSMS